jgi:hypothetical protein
MVSVSVSDLQSPPSIIQFYFAQPTTKLNFDSCTVLHSAVCTLAYLNFTKIQGTFSFS